jgi:hypothetical protein
MASPVCLPSQLGLEGFSILAELPKARLPPVKIADLGHLVESLGGGLEPSLRFFQGLCGAVGGQTEAIGSMLVRCRGVQGFTDAVEQEGDAGEVAVEFAAELGGSCGFLGYFEDLEGLAPEQTLAFLVAGGEAEALEGVPADFDAVVGGEGEAAGGGGLGGVPGLDVAVLHHERAAGGSHEDGGEVFVDATVFEAWGEPCGGFGAADVGADAVVVGGWEVGLGAEGEAVGDAGFVGDECEGEGGGVEGFWGEGEDDEEAALAVFGEADELVGGGDAGVSGGEFDDGDGVLGAGEFEGVGECLGAGAGVEIAGEDGLEGADGARGFLGLDLGVGLGVDDERQGGGCCRERTDETPLHLMILRVV